MHRCSVTLLRPYATSHEAFVHDVGVEQGFQYDERLEEWIDTVLDRIHSIAEEVRMKIDIDEIELRRLPSDGAADDELPLLSRKRANFVRQSHVLLSFHPPAEVLSFVAQCVQQNPCQRAVIALQRNRHPEDLLPILASGNTPVLGTNQYIRRMFAANVDREENMAVALREALIFPNGKAFAGASEKKKNDFITNIPEGYLDEFGNG